jgi:membrane-associated phospholipid phosphatase
LFFCVSAFAKPNTETAGDVLHVLLPVSAFVGSFYVEKESEVSYEGAWQLAKTGITSRMTVEVLKASVTKNRPDDSDDDAFPSGHAADTFVAAIFIPQRYG